jgi:DNA-binding response OmpR family regulator
MTKVLFVEDEPWGVDAYFLSLQKDGFQCDLARDISEAMAKLQNDKFDIVSLDIIVAGGQAVHNETIRKSAGLRLLQMIRGGKIQNCDPNVKVVVMTASANHHIEKQVRELRISDYLKKPVAFKKVIDTLTRLR